MVGIARNLIAPTGCKPGKSGCFDPLRVKMELGCAVQFGVGRKQGFQVLHQNRIADAAAADIKIMNRRSSLFGRIKNGLCSIKEPMYVSHLPAFHYLSDGLEASLGKTTLGLYFSDKGG